VGAASGNDRLKIVARFPSDADLVAEDLGGDFGFGIADEAGDLFGHGGFDALFDFDGLASVAEWRNVWFAFVDVFEGDVAFGEFAVNDFLEGADFEFVFGGEFDFVFLQNDFGFGAFEIEAVEEFFLRLVDGVFDFHRIDFGNNVERRHGGRIRRPRLDAISTTPFPPVFRANPRKKCRKCWSDNGLQRERT
jgi:hypothetical protein